MRLDPIQRSQAPRQAERTRPSGSSEGQSFEAALQEATRQQSGAPVEFSKHALERLEQRGIRLTDDLMHRLTGAIDRAESKGSRTTLVLVDQTAFVVGVAQRRVVTVADQDALRERVFTNIDSMVIA